MIEIWEPVKGYESLYKVSSFGRAFSLRRNKVLIPFTTIHGYDIVTLIRDKFTKKKITVHRLVMESFCPDNKGKKTINHIDGVRKNNHLSNLEWATHSENVLHSFHVLKRKPLKWGDCPRAKLSMDQVIEIKLRLSNNESQISIARKYNMTPGAISAIKKGRSWKGLKELEAILDKSQTLEKV